MSQQTEPRHAARQQYYVFYYDGWHIPQPDYVWIAEVEGKNPQDALETNMQQILKSAREILELAEDDLSDDRLQEALYIVPSDSWLSYREVYWRASLATSMES
jgi:hypothetical protein